MLKIIFFLAILASASAYVISKCRGKPASGPGQNYVQKFYYDPIWNLCFAFKYGGVGGNGNKHDTRMKCIDSCKNNDESMCLGPEQPKATTILQVDAPGYEEGKCGKGVHCPIGHFCYDGDGKVLCCPTEYEDAFSQAHNLVCPNGTKAAGVYEGFFIATVAKTCDDLICDPGYACQQVNKYFANCCEDKANM